MQQSIAAQPSASPSSFAGLLAAFTQPESKKTPEWNDDGLADDVTTISYERALRAHARYKPADSGDWRFAPDGAQGSVNAQKEPPPDHESCQELPAQSNPAEQTAPDRDLRHSSVTIRLSGAERAQLQQRAAEAGLTVSSYLRSCAFEAEALRAQVKTALAELRNAGDKGPRKQGTEGLIERENKQMREQGNKEEKRRGSVGGFLRRVWGTIGRL
jgi:hypothetical protein